jgi:hypothetical protein
MTDELERMEEVQRVIEALKKPAPAKPAAAPKQIKQPAKPATAAPPSSKQ